MDNFTIIAIAESYRRELIKTGVKAKRHHLVVSPSSIEMLEHIVYMLEEIPVLLEAGRREKVFRWLGFVQGVLWSQGRFSIEEVKYHNFIGKLESKIK